MKGLVAIVAVVWFAACSPDSWEAFVYEDKDNTKERLDIGVYQTVEECQQAAINELKTRGKEEAGSYQCGKNCAVKSGYGGNKMCEEFVE